MTIDNKDNSRREFLKKMLIGAGFLTLSACTPDLNLEALFQKYFKELTDSEKKIFLQNLEKKYEKTYKQKLPYQMTNQLKIQSLHMLLMYQDALDVEDVFMAVLKRTINQETLKFIG